LPKSCATLREKMQGKTPRSFNLARAAALGHLADTVGRNSPLYQAVRDIKPLKVRPTRTKHPALPDELRGMTAKMELAYAEIAWSMASTGMGFTELWGEWEVKTNHIAIHGTKRGDGVRARERIIPILMPISRPTRLYPAFRRALANAGPMRPYDLRRSYANWLEASGVPHSRAIQYMGHAATDMTDIYQWHEVARYLEEDAEKLRNYVLGGTPAQSLKLEKA
jgi:integrase